MIKNGTPASPATALASKVLPVPGWPTNKTPFGILAPISVNFLGFFKKSTISCNSCFSSSTPATSLNVILFLSSWFTTLALLFPKDIVLLPDCLPPIDINQNIKNIINNPSGAITEKIVTHTDWDSCSTVILPSFIGSWTLSIKLFKSGIFTFFCDVPSLNSTIAEYPSALISIVETCPASIFETSSEYVNFLSELSYIAVTPTIKITPIISHIANVFMPFFKSFPPFMLVFFIS